MGNERPPKPEPPQVQYLCDCCMEPWGTCWGSKVSIFFRKLFGQPWRAPTGVTAPPRLPKGQAMGKTVDDLIRGCALEQQLRVIAGANCSIAALDDAKFMDLRVRASINGEATDIYLPLPDCDIVVNTVRTLLERKAADARNRIVDMTRDLISPPPTQPERTEE